VLELGPGQPDEPDEVPFPEPPDCIGVVVLQVPDLTGDGSPNLSRHGSPSTLRACTHISAERGLPHPARCEEGMSPRHNRWLSIVAGVLPPSGDPCGIALATETAPLEADQTKSPAGKGIARRGHHSRIGRPGMRRPSLPYSSLEHRRRQISIG
jgi:hypothetical protein